MAIHARQIQAQNPSLIWLMDRNWIVTSVMGNSGLSVGDRLTFSPQQIMSTQPIAQNLATSSTDPTQGWGTWSLTSDPTRLTGQTAARIPFYIDHMVDQSVDPAVERLICTLVPAPSLPRIWVLAASTVVGILAGTAVGLAARVPGIGALAGFVAGISSSAVALLLGGALVQKGPNATWIATDTGPSGLLRQDDSRAVSQTLKVVSA